MEQVWSCAGHTEPEVDMEPSEDGIIKLGAIRLMLYLVNLQVIYAITVSNELKDHVNKD